jgi:hypothetical protein
MQPFTPTSPLRNRFLAYPRSLFSAIMALFRTRPTATVSTAQPRKPNEVAFSENAEPLSMYFVC